MNALTPYAAFIMRLAVGGVFLLHGISKFHRGIDATAHMLAGIGFPFATIFAVLLIAIETVGAVCVLLGILTRAWAAVMAVEMVVVILAVKLPGGGNFELEALLLAGAVTLVALGDGPLSLAVRFKHSST
jgi:putative oxidoreductase